MAGASSVLHTARAADGHRGAGQPSMLTYAGVCSRTHTYAHACSHMLTHAEVQVSQPELAYAHVRSLMLTHAEVQVSQPELDFGEVAVSDAVMLRQTVTNLSELPCRIGFLKLPRGVSMKPALGARFTCFTGIKVRMLTLMRLLGMCSQLLPYASRLLYSYKSTNTDANAPARRLLAPALRVTHARNQLPGLH